MRKLLTSSSMPSTTLKIPNSVESKTGSRLGRHEASDTEIIQVMPYDLSHFFLMETEGKYHFTYTEQYMC